jgi:hypothetical protein
LLVAVAATPAACGEPRKWASRATDIDLQFEAYRDGAKFRRIIDALLPVVGPAHHDRFSDQVRPRRGERLGQSREKRQQKKCKQKEARNHREASLEQRWKRTSCDYARVRRPATCHVRAPDSCRFI